ncbi:hypothetical protein N9L68_04755 [bacterium]|nr:hypothetical protein [bacterium]
MENFRCRAACWACGKKTPRLPVPLGPTAGQIIHREILPRLSACQRSGRNGGKRRRKWLNSRRTSPNASRSPTRQARRTTWKWPLTTTRRLGGRHGNGR